VIQIISAFSTKGLSDNPGFALAFLEYLLTMKLADNTAFLPYSEAVKDLERMCSLEMQKLAMKFPDEFMVLAREYITALRPC
jgi:exportin-5